MSTDIQTPLVEGQFEDAPEETQSNSNQNPRQGATFIDDPLLQWSEPEDEEELDGLHEESEEEYNEDRAEDEDWEVAERGLFLCLTYISSCG